MAKITKDDSAWRAELSPAAYAVTREGGTERAFTGEYTDLEEAGSYRCVCCDTTLFRSEDKYHSGSGWPSFTSAAPRAPVETSVDRGHGMIRTEVRCGRCDAHLGHVFDDGPPPQGLRYCINSVALRFAANTADNA